MSQQPPASPSSVNAAHAAIAAIYFDDSSDYAAALWTILKTLDPEMAALAEEDPRGAYRVSAGRVNALDSTPPSSTLQMPPLTDEMRAVLRNEGGAYGSEDKLYDALCAAAGLATLEPVSAVPVSLAEEVERLMDFSPDFSGSVPGMVRGGNYIEKSEVLRLIKAATSTPQPAKVPRARAEDAMTPQRAAFFLKRFKHDERMLGPNEQAALDYAVAAMQSGAPTDVPNNVQASLMAEAAEALELALQGKCSISNGNKLVQRLREHAALKGAAGGARESTPKGEVQ